MGRKSDAAFTKRCVLLFHVTLHLLTTQHSEKPPNTVPAAATVSLRLVETTTATLHLSGCSVAPGLDPALAEISTSRSVGPSLFLWGSCGTVREGAGGSSRLPSADSAHVLFYYMLCGIPLERNNQCSF